MKNESGGGGELETYDGSEKTGERNNKRQKKVIYVITYLGDDIERIPMSYGSK